MGNSQTVTEVRWGRNKEILVLEKLELFQIMGYIFTEPSGLPNKFHDFLDVELEG
jgi:hypothetical protein